MKATIAAGLAAAILLSGCAALRSGDAAPGPDHARHHPPAAEAPMAPKAEQQMMQMREMHRRMQAAKTPQERQALMAEHMKAMQGGMAMMCEMHAAPPQAPDGATMKRCMEMKDMAMQMMLDRERARAPAR